MTNNMVFSWAEKNGLLVHVDDPSLENGLKCGCCCPYCQETVLARRGMIKEHHFAHHSDNRGANLAICYMVTLYKLAEQIIQTKKCIMAPSYYGIFPNKMIEFVDVKIDNQFDREDKQPDVIATTADGKNYLIEFVFNYKVQRKTALDYKNLSCIEIDLKDQSLESLETFLLTSPFGRKWLNNEYYFESIEETYQRANKPVKVVDLSGCSGCLINSWCCAVQVNNYKLIIEHNGKEFALCKVQEYERRKFIFEQQKRYQIKNEYKTNYISTSQDKPERVKRNLTEQEKLERKIAREKAKQYKEEQRRRQEEHEAFIQNQAQLEKERFEKFKIRHKKEIEELAFLPPNCLNCKYNLPWGSRNGLGNCGPWTSLRTPQYPNPEYAKECKHFKTKEW